MRALSGLLVVLVGLCIAAPVSALVVDDLYSAEVSVEGRDTRARNEAFVQALDRVLVKVTGSRDVVDDDAFADLRRDARALVQQWSYTSGGLRAAFDAAAIHHAVREAGLPEWGSQRPRVLVWLALDDGRGVRRVLAAEDVGPLIARQGLERRLDDALPLAVRRWHQGGEVPAWLRDAVPARARQDAADDGGFFGRLTRRERARVDDPDAAGPDASAPPVGAELADLRSWLLDASERRGLPLILPRMDPADRLSITPADLCAFNEARIRAASRRYNPDAVVVGCGRVLGENAATRWTLIAADERRDWDGDLAEGVHGAADALAAAMAAAGGGDAGEMRLDVHGVATLEDYGRLLRHLERMSLVDSVAVDLIEGSSVRLRVRSRVDREQLDRALSLGRVLRPEADANGPGHYQLQQ